MDERNTSTRLGDVCAPSSQPCAESCSPSAASASRRNTGGGHEGRPTRTVLAPPADTLSACGPGLGRNWSVVTRVGAAAVVSANAVRCSDARTFKLGVSEGE